MTKALEFVSQCSHTSDCDSLKSSFLNIGCPCTCGRDEAIKQLSKASEDTAMLDSIMKLTESLHDSPKSLLIQLTDFASRRRQSMKGNKG